MSCFATACVPCTDPGLPREVALKQVNEYFEQSKKDYVFAVEPAISAEKFDPVSKVWSFDFKSGACVITIATDGCGPTDIAGLTEACRIR